MSEPGPWYPTNGTDGDFLASYCDGCVHDDTRDDDTPPCEIIMTFLIDRKPHPEFVAIDASAGMYCGRRVEKTGTTYDDDHLVLNFNIIGRQIVMVEKLGLTWPPPETIYTLVGQEVDPPMRQTRRSTITDTQRSRMTNVARGAEYFPIDHPMFQ